MTMIDAPRFNGVGWAAGDRDNWFIHDGVSGQNISEREITLDRGTVKRFIIFLH